MAVSHICKNPTYTNICRPSTHTHTHTHTHVLSSDAIFNGVQYNIDWTALRCPPLSNGIGNEFYQATWDYVQDTRSGMAKWGDIIRWDTSAVLNMANALSAHRTKQGNFDNTKNTNPKASVFTTDSLPWNTAKVTNMVAFLYGAEAFNADVSAFDTSSVTTMRLLFQEAQSFNGTYI